MYRTHLVFALFLGLIFFPYMQDKIFFIPVLLLSSMLPDIDCMHSKLGKHWIWRPLQWCIKHRGVFHSFTLCLLAALLISFTFPVIAFPFFLGYASHLFGDAMTNEGIRPWWPTKKELKGFFKTGGKVEKVVFICLLVGCAVLVLKFLII